MAADAPINPVRIPPGPRRGRIGSQIGGLGGAGTTAGIVLGAVVMAVGVARFATTGENLTLTLAALAATVAFVVGAALGRARSLLFIGLVLLAFVVPDVLANAGASTLAIMTIAGLAAIALFYASRSVHTITVLDAAAFLIFVTAAVLPAIVSGTPSTIGGNAVLILGTYLIARVAAPTWNRLVALLLVVGAFHGVVAILSVIPETSSMIPFVPILGGEPNPSSRAVALFNNPNTFGNLEAMIVVLALWTGVARRLWPLVGLCVIGIFLSGSREALVGLIVTSSVIMLRWPGRAVGPVAALGFAAALLIALVPNAQQRFDPGRYAADSALLERFDLWSAAGDAIVRSPIIGYGQSSGLRAVDQAYLNWLVDGGVFGTAIWVTAILLLLAAFPARPVIVVMLVVGVLGNPFAGPTLALMLVLVAASHELIGTGANEEPGPVVVRAASPAGT